MCEIWHFKVPWNELAISDSSVTTFIEKLISQKLKKISSWNLVFSLVACVGTYGNFYIKFWEGQVDYMDKFPETGPFDSSSSSSSSSNSAWWRGHLRWGSVQAPTPRHSNRQERSRLMRIGNSPGKVAGAMKGRIVWRGVFWVRIGIDCERWPEEVGERCQG